MASVLVRLVTIGVIASHAMVEALLINRPQDMFSRYENERAVMEWDILADNYQPFKGEAFLYLRKDTTLLFIVHLFNGNFDISEVKTTTYRVNFSNSRSGRFGVVVSNIRLEEAGVYSCAYKDNNESTVEYGTSRITLFVFANPQKPTIRASGPIMTGHDVTLECVTQSHSQPSNKRPEMKITWFKDGALFGTIPHDQAKLVDDKVQLDDLGGNIQQLYNCSVREDGSSLIQYSNAFPLVLLALQSISSDNVNISEGDDVTLKWRSYPKIHVAPNYNRTVSFTRNSAIIASWNMQYLYWTSKVDRMTYYNPAADQHGFKLHRLLPADIGHYACVYQDEFGTVVTSKAISLGLQGHTLPPHITTPGMIDTTSVTDSSLTPHTAGSVNTKAGVNHALIISCVLGAAVVILVIVLVVYLVKRRRKPKDPPSLMRPREPRDDTVRYRETGSVISIYNTLRESLMVPDDVLVSSPSLPPRDETYNHPFEETHKPLASCDIEDSYLTPLGCAEVTKGDRDYNNAEMWDTKLCNNQVAETHHRENEYLAPVRQSEQQSKP